jgi:cytochrome d ubiquinol oxidase subunit I
MHTPAGFEMIDGKAYVTSWFEVIFNPSFPYRFTHMMIASGLTVSFLLAGISAYRWLKKDVSDAVMATMRAGVFVAAVLIPVQIFVGDLHGLNTLEHQPAKLAAMEGIWKTQKGVPAVLFALPDEKSKTNNFEIAIPNLASLYLTHHWDGEVQGLDAFEGKHPPVAPVFWAFRVMVGIGLLMLVVSWWATFQLRIKSRPSQMIAKILVAMTFAGWVALIAGWYVTEIGRQPWLVYGLLTVAQAASAVPATSIALTLTIYLLLYILLLGAYISVVFYLAKKAIQPAPKRDQKEVLSAKVNFTELKNV